MYKLYTLIIGLFISSSSLIAQCVATPVSLISNYSFEANTGCPSGTSQMNLVNTWLQPFGGTSDYFNTCGFTNISIFNPPPMPIPGGGSGYVGFYDNSTYDEYIGSCLTTPMVAGNSYTFQFEIAPSAAGVSTTTIGLFGTTNCANMSTNTNGTNYNCPSAVSGSFVNIVNTPLITMTSTAWTTVTITFIAPSNIAGVAIGAACGSTGSNSTYFYMDELVLNTTASFAPPTANAGPNRTTTCTSPTASLAGSASGGTPAYSYSWNNGAGTSATPTVNPGTNTNYTLTVTDQNGCTDTDVVLVTVNKVVPTANAGTNRTTTCTSPTASLAGSGGGTYSWNNGAGTSATPTVNPGTTTNYTLTVTSANGCTDTDVTTVTVNETPPTANAGADFTTNCITPTATLSGSGGGNYSWDNGAGTSATPTVNPATITTYTLTVTDPANGCTDTDLATVTVNETPPTANAGPNRTTTCTTPTASLAGSGGGTYSWDNGAGTSATPTVNPGSTTNYTLTVTGTNGCTDTDVTTVTVDKTPPNANAGADVVVNCSSPTATLAGSGGGSYSWDNGAGTSATPTVSPSSTTTYTLTVTGANGCTDTDATLVTVNGAVPTANAGADFTTNCITPTATLAGSGGGNYSWDNGAGTSATPTVNPATTTTYTLTVTDPANGCTDTDAVIITVDEALPTATAGADITLDCATTTGNFTATGVGSYSWASPNGTSAVAGFPVADTDTPGNYTVTVTAANGCTDTDVATLTIDQTDPVANAGTDQTSSCAVPTVSLDGSGSSGAGITYSWSGPNVTGGATTNTATADAAGTYTLVVTGSNSCTHSDQVDVLPDLNVPVANAGADQVIDCNNSSVNLDGSGSDAGASITYSWTTTGGNITGSTTANSTTADLDGTYTITVTNTGNGCFATDDVAVTQDTITPVNSVTNNSYVIDCNNPTATFDASGSTGSGNTFNWTTVDGNIVSGGNTDAPIVNESGTYSLSIASANGCGNLNTTNVTVTMDTVSPTIQINIADTLTCNILQITLDASGSQAGVTYNWTTIDGLISSGGTTATPIADSSGTYTLTVTSANGCTTTSNQTVVDSEVPVAHIVTNTTEGEVDLDVIFSDTSSGMGLTYYWDFGTDNMDYDTVTPTTFTYTDFQQYEVVLTITDQYGCIATDTVVINALELSAIEVPNIFTPNGDGDNDYFNVRGGGIKNISGNIMNRWGQVVYEWDSQFGGWDGHSVSGSKAAEGTYFYFINVDFNDGHSEEYTGHLMLKR